ncbi:SGNH/GDSL hydrolase family protein [Nocardioides rubriscoriae]|uniref:SGNH/GDSL hydrolase family protein n=1 Tax=Nocardioides rubriscoriae TaxID=642762 RepID=UPI0011E00DBB|nr:SGNH/GDSL hydrolase family protein [Nocardioides rubriscoriae]
MIRAAAAVATAALLAALSACSGDPDDGAAAVPPSAASTPSTPSSPSTPATPATSGSPTTPASPSAPAVGPQYVALGDSYAAAPGVPATSGADGCFRSSGNYAQLVAARTGLSVTDVTCSGATTQDVLTRQVPSLSAETELVTVGIGGNDSDLFTSLLQSCLGLASSDPGGTPCSDAIGAQVDQTLPRTEADLGTLFDAIAEAAPDAQVLVVGYPRLLPTSGSCPDLVPLAAGDYPLLNEVTDRLSGALRTQASAHDFEFVDLARPSRGHDICSADPWVNGVSVAPDGTIPFHPFAAEQRAVAGIITTFL